MMVGFWNSVDEKILSLISSRLLAKLEWKQKSR